MLNSHRIRLATVCGCLMRTLFNRQSRPAKIGASFQVDLGAFADKLLVVIPFHLTLFQRIVLLATIEYHHQSVRFATRLEAGNFFLAFLDFRHFTHHLRDHHFLLDLAQIPIVRIAYIRRAGAAIRIERTRLVSAFSFFGGFKLIFTQPVGTAAQLLRKHVRLVLDHV